jgi:sarcosine/dimethylglycine N-methyltransferase
MSTGGKSSEIVNVARDYYNSDDADNFYFEVWGGEDIHIGLYQKTDESIAVASERTVATMAEQLGDVGKSTRIADFGAGYGGSARWLVRHFGCHVSCVNLSEVQNDRNRQMNAAAGLDDRIDVYDAGFEDAPLSDADFDHVWSQDSLLHSPDRPRVLDEVDRILKPGGSFVFTDPMQADDCPDGVLQPILDRIHLTSLGSPKFYREAARACGLEEVGFDSHTEQLVTHYSRVLQETGAREHELAGSVSREYIEQMKKGLQYWIDGGRAGHLAWGIFRFRKP